MTSADILSSSGKYPERVKLADAYVRANSAETARRVSMFLTSFNSVSKESKERSITSGFRDKMSNTRARGAKASCHLFGMAVDIEDKDGRLDAFCVANEDLLKHFALWVESPKHTPGWCHMQTRPVGTGTHIFLP